MVDDNDDWTIVTSNKTKTKKSLNHSTIIPPPSPSRLVIAKGDSAASNHYWALRDTLVLDNVTDDDFNTTVTLPDKTQISSIQRGALPFQLSLIHISEPTRPY